MECEGDLAWNAHNVRGFKQQNYQPFQPDRMKDKGHCSKGSEAVIGRGTFKESIKIDASSGAIV